MSAGSDIDVTIAVANYGFGGQINDTIPEGFEYVSSTSTGASFDSATRTISFTLVDEATFGYTVTAPDAARSYTFSGTLRDSDLALHDIGGDSVVTVEGAAGASATRAFGSTSVMPEDNVEVTITVANYGFGGQIMDTVPPGFAYVSSEPVGGTFDSNTRIVSFTLVDESAFRYTVTTPSTDGNYVFTGTLMDSDLGPSCDRRGFQPNGGHATAAC